MHVKEAIQHTLNLNQMILTSYLSDLSDAELLLRPVPEANHIAWQLGHLISAECMLLGMIPGATVPELPPGFAKQHSKETAHASSTEGFLTKKEYLDLLTRVRAATLASLENLSEADLDKPVQGDIARVAPTVGKLLILLGSHTLMHGGQIVPLRRKLGKPVLI